MKEQIIKELIELEDEIEIFQDDKEYVKKLKRKYKSLNNKLDKIKDTL